MGRVSFFLVKFRPAPQHVTRIAANENILDLWRKDQGINRQMTLHEPAVGLGLNRGQLNLPRRNAPVDPRAEDGGLHAFRAIKDQLADDLLHPGCAGFGIGGNHDVIVANRTAGQVRLHAKPGPETVDFGIG